MPPIVAFEARSDYGETYQGPRARLDGDGDGVGSGRWSKIGRWIAPVGTFNSVSVFTLQNVPDVP